VQFEEEQIIKRADNSILHDNLSTITMLINDYAATFPVYNPVTQVKTGTTGTVAQLYAMIWSVYINQAVLRDAYLATVAVEQAAQTAAQVASAKVITDVAALYAAFTTEDANDLAAAEALAATKATQEEKDVVMADYQTAKAAKVVALTTATDLVRSNAETAATAAAAQAVIDAQAAYDAVINA
jgi:hypothetical protein